MTEFTEASEWDGRLSSMLESLDVAARRCDGLDEPCGSAGSTRLYVDGHVFQLCPECAWRLTDEYRRDGVSAPWDAT